MPERKIKELTYATTSSTMTVGQAAKTLGIKESVMRNYLYEGLFTTLKFQGFTFVDPKEVKTWKEEHQR